jgi:hypothetical protein
MTWVGCTLGMPLSASGTSTTLAQVAVAPHAHTGSEGLSVQSWNPPIAIVMIWADCMGG